MKNSFFVIVLIFFFIIPKAYTQNVDITWLPGCEISTQYDDSPANEGLVS